MSISRFLCLSGWMCLYNCLFLSVLVFRTCLYNCFESLCSTLEDVLSCLWICLSNLTRHVPTASLDLEDISLKPFLGPFVQDNIFWQSSLFLFCYMGPVPTIISRFVCLNYRTWPYSSFSTAPLSCLTRDIQHVICNACPVFPSNSDHFVLFMSANTWSQCIPVFASRSLHPYSNLFFSLLVSRTCLYIFL